MAGFRKRTFANAFGTRKRIGKRRKFTRRRRVGRSSASWSTKAGSASGLGFRSKRLSRKRFNSILWTSTIMKQHYRSNGSLAGAINSTASQGQITIAVVQALDNGIAPFWQASGGTIEVNQGQGVPVFGDDIIVRGGLMGIKLFNESVSVPLSINVYLVRNTDRPTNNQIPAAAPYGWDPSLVPDFFHDVGKVIFKRSFQLEASAEMTIERRIPIMKVDQLVWATDAKRLVWLVTVGDPQTIVTATCRVVSYFNLSFAADNVGTT